MQKILVVGGTGMLGQPVARQLKADGFDVSIMTTDRSKAESIFSDGFGIVDGDVTDIESLKPALEGKDAVYLSLSSHLDEEKYRTIEIEGTANVATVAREAGLKRIGMISGANSEGIEEGIIYLDAKVQAERAVIESGVPYSIMRPSWFFETLPSFIQMGKAVVLGDQPGRFAWLAASDFAKQVSTAFANQEAANRCFYNFGPARLTILEALTKFCQSRHPDLKPEVVSFAQAKMFTMLPGMTKLKPVIPFFEYIATRSENVDSTEADNLLGPNRTDLDQWLAGKA